MNRASALAGAILLLAATSLPSPVAANHGGRDIGSLFACDRPGVSPPRCTSVADGFRHIVVFDATLTEGLASSFRDAMAEDYERTDLAVVEHAEVTAATDVIVFSEDYGDNGAAGWVYCPPDAPQGVNRYGDRWCRQQQLLLNLNARYAGFFADDGSRDHVACHELGHTVGLRHWGNPPRSAEPAAATCMNADTPNGPTDLHQIDVDHINGYGFTRHPLRRPRMIDPFEPRPNGGGRPASAWPGSSVQATEVEHFASLGDMARSADAVVRGRVVAVIPGRSFGGATGQPLTYASATLRVDELLGGSLASGSRREVTLEVPLFGGPEQLASAAPTGEGIFFLRNKGTSAAAAGLAPEIQEREAAYYRLVVLNAAVMDDAGTAAAAGGEHPFLAALNGLSFDEVTETVRAAGR